MTEATGPAPPGDVTARPSAWAKVRALLIFFVICLQWADAVPLPELKKRDLENPIAQAELDRWTGVLNGLGVSIGREELLERALVVGDATRSARRAVLRPWAPFRRLTGTGQGWGLFAYPDPFAGRLTIVERLEGEDAWRDYYLAPAPASDGLTAALRYRRVRGVWDDAGDRPRPRKVYDHFVDWIAHRRFSADPSLGAIEVRLDLHRVLRPDQGEEPPDKRRHARMRERADVMGEPPS